MDWQLGLTLACLALAVAYLARRTWRTWNNAGGKGCQGCGCAAKAAAPADAGPRVIPTQDLLGRLRAQGQKPG